MTSDFPSADARLIEIYTDGSFDHQKKSGGWAFVAYEGGREFHRDSGGLPGDTNNAFELIAVLRAAAWGTSSCLANSIRIWTDSWHVMEGFYRWLPIWRNNGWKKVDPNPRRRRRPVADIRHWQALDEVTGRGGNLRIEWCKAHSGDAANDSAHRLANACRISPPNMII